MAFSTVFYNITTQNSASLISGSNLAPGESFWFNTAGGNSFFSGSVIATSLSGSLTRLSNGLSYLVAGTNITITSQSNGSITIDFSGTTGNNLWFSATNLTSSNSGSIEISGSILSKGVITASQGFSGSLTRLSNGLSYLVAGTNITITSQSNGSVTIDATGGSGNNLWYSIANLTSSNSGAIEVSGSGLFKQNLSVTGTSVFTGGLSGSLTRLSNGLSYLVAGTNIAITSQSNGSVTIDFSGTNGNNLWFSATNLTSSNSGSVEISGSVFSKGIITASQGFSGSLTRLSNGLSYLVAGTNVTITSQSNGSITIDATGGSGNNLWFSVTNLTSSNSGSIEISGSILSKGVITASQGFSGSLTRLSNGLSYLVAGTNVTITSQSNGSVTIDAAAGSGNNLWYSIANLTSSNSGAIEVSGSGLFKQNLSVTGTSVFTGGLSGSLTTLSNGLSYLVAGTNVTITSQSNGSITVASTAGSPKYQMVGAYTTTTATSSSPQVCGQFEFVAADHFTTTVRLKILLSTQTTTASIRLYNITSGAYVDLGGTGATVLSSSTSTPTVYFSQNLLGVGGWSAVSASYELRLHSNTTTDTAFLGSAYIISS